MQQSRQHQDCDKYIDYLCESMVNILQNLEEEGGRLKHSDNRIPCEQTEDYDEVSMPFSQMTYENLNYAS
ncbi:hypothetical protein BTVI_101765 [Pitangus sulphuratus]|nr:hypothetical protein BTVI_101765 [Pitangus sulphuratus]